MEQHTTNGLGGQPLCIPTAQARKDLIRFAAILRIVTETVELALELDEFSSDRGEG